MPSRSIHVVTHGKISIFLWLSSILSFIYIYIYIYICIYIYIYLTAFFPFHPLIETDYFHILTIVNDAAVNMGGDIYLFELVLLFSLDKCPEVELLDHIVVL